MQPSDQTIEIPGLRLGARSWGPSKPPPGSVGVLALHGWLDNAASYDALAPRLGERTFIALDLPGHGLSDHVCAGDSYQFVDYVAAVHAAISTLGWSRVSLVGHSLGASVACVYAGTFPDAVHRLVLIEGLGPLSEPEEGAPTRLARALQAETRHGRRADRPPVYDDVDTVVERLRAAQSSLSERSARILLERGLAAVDGGVTWRSDRRLRHPSRLRLSEPQVLAFLESITAPTLLVHARDGIPMNSDMARRRIEAVEDVRVVNVDGGHHVHLETPDAVADLVAAFLDGREPD